ncbi:MAG: hypothetical protein ACXVSX_13610, partial [Solirubrobacteraceae bacterium]
SAQGATSTSGCEAAVPVTGDTPGTTRTCTAYNGPESASATVFIKIDKTPPAATAATAGRPPDANGWFNHPVAVTWSGTDATSGIAGCTQSTYGGPDASPASLSGTCTDRAGNVSAPLATTLAYDATPPSIGDVSATPRDGGVLLHWTASPDATAIRVSRSPGGGGAASSPVYDGTGSAAPDDGLVGGTRYTYTLTATDAAGNAATATASAVPAGMLLAPAPGAQLTRPPVLRWKAVKGARYYNVQLFRGKRKLLSTWPTRPHLALRTRWTYRGRRHRLVAGRYTWYVWPGYGARNLHRYGKLIGRRTFTQR